MRTKMRDTKIQKLMQDGRSLYHAQDLAVLWGIEKENTLHTTIKRYIQRGILYRIHRGFYATVPILEIDPVLLGLSSLRRYGYLSTESVLAQNGIIFQQIKKITLVSNLSRQFKITNHSFLVRCLKEEFLYNEAGISVTSQGRIASVERAVADLLYYNSHYHFDAPNLINWKQVEKIKNKIGY
jgi:predicted transcriptional regulator of viral defense system